VRIPSKALLPKERLAISPILAISSYSFTFSTSSLNFWLLISVLSSLLFYIMNNYKYNLEKQVKY